MELATTLKGETIQNRVREIGINPNYWYPVAWADQLKPNQVLPVTLWQQSIAIYRDNNGQVHALENACPHKGVELHKGQVQGNRLVCPYHGWEFNPAGECVNIPYFPPEQKLPCANARSYPSEERYGIVWVFPGEAGLATLRQIPEVPEYAEPNCLMIPITGIFKAHFSISNENTMDVFHGFLHKNLQGWFDPALLKLQQTDDSVQANYRVSYQGFLTKFLGLSTGDDGITTRTVSIHYQYPHYHSTMEGVSSLYLMRLPVGPNETRSFSLLFLPNIRMPKWLQSVVKPVLVPLVRRFLFMRFLEQDVEMMESEQRIFRQNPQRRYVEVNPAILALQRVLVRQYEQFVQQSSQLEHRHPEPSDPTQTEAEILVSLSSEPASESPVW
ncbi:MAG: Rieske 2Fe-2S domain-containing protein [Leptolyngbya sp. IPPAS B-1204]|uniref:Aromatic ring-hydroxylating dioxygenase subunit alpha n=1 Tax=Leptolyngbya sp. NK1-12 TaxID=2547451 RepID=A0AA96WEF0_9CYAN|nr:aromatic ring-hydroxylating dioxygenase subunit alpha [Leptolyngbya sp. NK1-12]MBF2050382.1 aromatic ring-hydroxylating dioxygenase subunit alpha [Elainella sp. C42_A2020_010]RNJ68455.1 MAG: aromatic ring-hydroxylating dioxygenase subunit alpha [Leptolyngbya sp. IPPAS B-1204]WNZ23734.1 aromatic ring-hydroxylating dioxygenase subunit alpha [Leptolyngbya sp. NK1-12]